MVKKEKKSQKDEGENFLVGKEVTKLLVGALKSLSWKKIKELLQMFGTCMKETTIICCSCCEKKKKEKKDEEDDCCCCEEKKRKQIIE